MQPLQFLLLHTGGWIAGSTIVHLIDGITPVRATAYVMCWLTGVVCYACGRDSRR